MVTMAEIAKKAGVSPAVVSRVINNDRALRIGKETRARVEAVIRELNYAPNVVAQSLASSKSGLIAVVVHDIANPVYGEILRGAQEQANKLNKAIILGDASAGMVSNTRLARMIGGGGVDGLVLQAAGAFSDEIIASAVRQEVPVVLLQAGMNIDAHLVHLPDHEAAELATQHIIDLGHKRIGCLATQQGLTFTDQRLAGWRQAMGSHVNEDLVVYSAPHSDAGAEGTSELLDRHPDLTAIVCFNVVSAVGALREIRARGLNVPDDLSIIAIHDVKFAQDLSTPLSVVSTPLAEMGQLAVETVCSPPETSQSTTRVLTKPTLLLRNSTSKPRQV
ncbi:LacI family DNA-binding transcriptional regulator [Pacificoceanicola onchidii]|uniref:LacI family DNA-binding transcriptional regulator n=1 Tax=Pacificoceanicola onchidii TaxID=2562685 RepID=UPI001455E46A|nr:LacI family DNA-binding transcriptional regulator [Pacificoceanicola onchidii]